MTLVSRGKRQIVGYDIASDRSQKRIQKLVDDSIKASKYYSDAFPVYKEICYEGEHFSLKNKSQTYTVEGVNSDIRKYISALQRSSKCFFKSLETMKAVFKIFASAFNKFANAKFLHPSLKSFFPYCFCLNYLFGYLFLYFEKIFKNMLDFNYIL